MAEHGGGFALSSGGVIDRGAPPENIDALIEASERYGSALLMKRKNTDISCGVRIVLDQNE